MEDEDVVFGWEKYMSKNKFDQIARVLYVSQIVPTDCFSGICSWLNKCTETWRSAWTAGEELIPDESMIFWTGSGVHLTHMPRKPTP